MMQPRHVNELLNRLDQLEVIGVTQITTAELKLWYGQKNMSTGMWRDIEDRWLNELGQKTLIYIGASPNKSNPVCWALVWAEGLTTTGSWLNPISEHAKRLAE